MRWLLLPFGVAVVLGCTGSRQSMQSANSSGNSANSSNTSGTSGQSANSSGQSAQSSNTSADSSRASNTSSQSSANSNQSSAQSSNTSGQSSQSSQATSQSSQASWSQVAVGSALLSAVGGGITTTVYSVKWKREAQLAQDELKRLQEGPQPQPMPYKVEPIPLNPPGPQQPPPPQPQPGFEPAPFPKRTSVDGPALDGMIQARSWLLANELQLLQDLALGAGPTLDDLAGVAGIAPEHRAHFGRLMQKHRQTFRVTAEVTPEQAAAVFSRIGDLVMNDPVLRPDGLKVLAAW